MTDGPDSAYTPEWTPPALRRSNSRLVQFVEQIAETGIGPDGLQDSSQVYEDLHRWSVEQPNAFWQQLATWLLPNVADWATTPAMSPSKELLPQPSWFEGVTLNVAEQIITAAGNGDMADEMVINIAEDGDRAVYTRGDIASMVGAVEAGLRSVGVTTADRVAAYMPNTVETLVMMLATASLGATFTSCSPDFGVDGVLDRFGQVEPKVLLVSASYQYGGKTFDRQRENAAIAAALSSVVQVVECGRRVDSATASTPSRSASPPKAADAVTNTAALDTNTAHTSTSTTDAVPSTAFVRWESWLDSYANSAPSYTPQPFDHPWYVLYSSGTTGVPKCMVHRAGGVLLMHMKEHQLQLDIRPGDRTMYYTTCGWMMWNWLVSIPASGASIVLYDGNPFTPSPTRLFDIAATEQLAFLGVSAKFLDAVKKADLPTESFGDLTELRTIASTGSPLLPETCSWVYDHIAPLVGDDGLHVASISGGTDLCACLVCGDPTSPVYAGELQRPALGINLDIWSGDNTAVGVGERGELVCASPFPSMPLGFWNDGPLGSVGPRYHAAYFERFATPVWAQGDFATWTPSGGVVIHGRSDTTLNPGGVRIGTAEIYRQVETIDRVQESLVFGREVDDDVQIVLLVRLLPGDTLSPELESEIRTRIRTGCSPRHVPGLIVTVDDLPRTRSGKLVELAVSDKINGREVRNTSALANPEALDGVVASVHGAISH